MSYYLRRIAFLAAMFFSAVSAQADPLPMPAPVPMSWTESSLRIGIPILLEAVCVVLLLRRVRTPRFFILWILAMHVLTYPLFRFMLVEFDRLSFYRHLVSALSFLISRRLTGSVSFYVRIAIPEVLIIFIEGSLIYLMCRFVPSRTSTLRIPSIPKCWAVSLAGNICSVVISALAFYVDFRIHAA